MIYWAGLLIIKDRKVLAVRERGKTFFALPGGSKKNQETTLETLNREIKEELMIEIDFTVDHFMETELPGKGENEIVHFNVYLADPAIVKDGVNVGDDIEEFKWIDYEVVKKERIEISHLIERRILPDLKVKKMID